MKGLISVLVALLLMWLVFFKLDPAIVNWFLNLIPASHNDWKPMLKVIGWIVVVFFTGGFTIWIAALIGTLFYGILKSTSK